MLPPGWPNDVYRVSPRRRFVYATKPKAKRATLTSRDRFGTEPPCRMRLSQDHAVYAGMVETFDNGGVSTSEGWPTSNSPLRAGKGWLYEGGIRVPAIAPNPKYIPPARTAAPLVERAGGSPATRPPASTGQMLNQVACWSP